MSIKNKKSGLSIDFNQLLPEGYNFAIDKTNPRKEIERDGGTCLRRTKYDLNGYEGMKSLDDYGFYCAQGSKEISYGDLTKKGNMLSLLHEIAHAWQDVYHENAGKGEYEKFHKQVSSLLIAYYQLSEYSKGIEEKKKNDDYEPVPGESVRIKEGINHIKKELEKLDIIIDYDNLTNSDKELADNEVTIKNSLHKESFVIKSKKMKELLKNYQLEERNAWAHAIKILRFFRKNGIDVEPELKTLNDIKEKIDYCLGTYQNSIDREIELDKKFKFLKN